MDEQFDQTRPEVAAAEPTHSVTRRHLLMGAGGAAGAVVAAGAGVVAPTTAEASSGGQLAVSAKGTAAFELVGQILQNGEHFETHGYITRAAGIDDAALFADSEQSESTAFLTIAGEAQMTGRSVRPNVFVLDAVGELAIFHHEAPGANFDDPGSFADGAEVARFEVSVQDILTVIAEDEGIPTINGDMRQTSGATFSFAGQQRRFGRPGSLLRLSATGHGVRFEPDPPVARLELGGQAVTAG